MSAQFHTIMPDLMPRAAALLAAIRLDLVKHNLIGADDPLPEPPVAGATLPPQAK
jgi:hypothetical protein